MAIVVEALTLIIRRLTLDLQYPGGSEKYLEELGDPSFNARWICADEDLTAASFLSDHLGRALEHISERGLLISDESGYVDAAILDELTGPTLTCEWMEWARSDDDLTRAWVAGGERDSLTTPADFKPARLVRTDVRDEDHFVKLAEEAGETSWLDTRTGNIVKGPADSDGSVGLIMKNVRHLVEERDWPFTLRGPRVLEATLRLGCILASLEVKVQEDAKLLSCSVLLPFFVPDSHCQAVTRIIDVLNADDPFATHLIDDRNRRIANTLRVDVSRDAGKPAIAQIFEHVSTRAAKTLSALAGELSHWIAVEADHERQ